MTDDQADVDLESVLADIRAAVTENTASGQYSDALEAELQSHFARLIGRRDGPSPLLAAWATVDQLDAARREPTRDVSSASRVPGGGLVHTAAKRVVDRQLIGHAEKADRFNEGVVATLRSMISLLDTVIVEPYKDMLHELDTLQDRVVALERVVGRDRHYAPLDERIVALEDEVARRAFTPNYSTLELDNTIRGDAAAIRAEYENLADSLVGVPGPIFDIGAGRGELLALLAERDVEAWGVDVDVELVELGIADGLDVRHQDGLEALRSVKPGSLGAVIVIHVIEHLHGNELLELVTEAYSRLAPGGMLVLETPNPQSLYIYARAFWLDPTHLRPVHPVYLEFVLRSVGFEDIKFDWTALPGENERLVELPDGDESVQVHNENVRRVNQLLFAAQNYRVIATR